MNILTWVGIIFCLTQSAMFSGLNIACFSISRLRLDSEAKAGDQAAKKVLVLRRDSNFLLTTILWGNVGINVLLTLLSSSILAGFAAFLFSTFVITFAGEIIPQAYFSRRALKMAALLAPVLRFYQLLLYPVAKPSAWLLDRWLGTETTQYLRERQLKRVISEHIESDKAEIDLIEGIGALNFLDIDDIPIVEEGENVDPASVITLPLNAGIPVIPAADSPTSQFVRDVQASGKKWVIIIDESGQPHLLLDANDYLRAVLMGPHPVDGYKYCHRPVVITNPQTPLGHIISDLRRGLNTESDSAIDKDIVLLWTEKSKHVITGADILGRLLRGIS